MVLKSNTAAFDTGKAAAKEKDSKITDKLLTSSIETTSETIFHDGSYSLSEHPTMIVEAGSEDIHTNLDIPGDHRTENYDAVTKDVLTTLAERKDSGSENGEATSREMCTSLNTLEEIICRRLC